MANDLGVRRTGRREFLALVGAAAAAPLFPARFARAASRRVGKPNIVVILADDLGYADLGCQQCPDVPTPHTVGLTYAHAGGARAGDVGTGRGQRGGSGRVRDERGGVHPGLVYVCLGRVDISRDSAASVQQCKCRHGLVDHQTGWLHHAKIVAGVAKLRH